MAAINQDRLQRKPGAVAALFASALALPGLKPISDAHAESEAAGAHVQLRYYHYEDWQAGGQDRMRVRSPMLWVESPLGESTKVEASALIDDMSGASPFYLDSLSGASGLGIEEKRKATDIRVTREFGDFSVSLGGAYSSEDDYISKSASLEGTWTSADRNTTVAVGFSPSFDRITSTNNLMLLERRKAYQYLVGVTQVLTPTSIMMANLTYGNADGYHNDQYKYFDVRPESRDQWAILLRHNQYVPSLDAALHSDYRLYTDTWGITSHTFAFAWYQPIGDRWMVRPSIRYYSQSRADFFSSDFPPPTEDFGFLSFDQRMSGFGSLSAGLKVSADLGADFTLDFLVDFFEQRAGWKLGGDGSAAIDHFSGRVLGVGLGKRF